MVPKNILPHNVNKTDNTLFHFSYTAAAWTVHFASPSIKYMYINNFMKCVAFPLVHDIN